MWRCQERKTLHAPKGNLVLSEIDAWLAIIWGVASVEFATFLGQDGAAKEEQNLPAPWYAWYAWGWWVQSTGQLSSTLRWWTIFIFSVLRIESTFFCEAWSLNCPRKYAPFPWKLLKVLIEHVSIDVPVSLWQVRTINLVMRRSLLWLDILQLVVRCCQTKNVVYR